MSFIGMPGVRVLITAHQEAEREHSLPLVANVPDRVRCVLRLANVQDLLPIAGDS